MEMRLETIRVRSNKLQTSMRFSAFHRQEVQLLHLRFGRAFKDVVAILASGAELSQKTCLFHLSESITENPRIKHFFWWFFIIIF